MKQLLIIFFIAASLNSFSQKKDTTTKKMTAQDSAAVLQAEYGKFIDSLTTKTSIKSFYDFLTEAVTVKQWQDAKWVEMYDFFLRTKGNEWLQKRNKPKQ